VRDDAHSGIRHIQRLLTLAESLRALGVSVYHHEWHELAMGSWSLIAGTRHRSYLFTWDGRDGVISIRGPFQAGQGSASKISVASATWPLGSVATNFTPRLVPLVESVAARTAQKSAENISLTTSKRVWHPGLPLLSPFRLIFASIALSRASL
jgi:hypothetical protein